MTALTLVVLWAASLRPALDHAFPLYYTKPLIWIDGVAVPLVIVGTFSHIAKHARHTTGRIVSVAFLVWFGIVTLWGLFVIIDSRMAPDSDSSTQSLSSGWLVATFVIAAALVAGSTLVGRMDPRHRPRH